CLCSEGPLQFDIEDKGGVPLTNANNVPRNKTAVFASFFDVAKLEAICRAHGLKFAHRISYVDQFTIRIMGEVIPEGADRGKRPISSTYEERRKAKKGGAGLDWNEEARAQGLSPAQIDLELKGVDSEIKKLEAEVKAIRKTLGDKLSVQSTCSLEHRQ
ncbi:hypothetical protein EC968_010685, partial [Mortierella alpina]